VRLYQAYSMNPQAGTEMIVAPVTLEGRHVRLEPLWQAHPADLTAVGLDEQLWRWIPVPVRTPDEMFAYRTGRKAPDL
jgi:hypothetical protein